MPEKCRLHFSIGPVQGFVEQSRRTRDLWASSFILSQLANAAMSAVDPHCGQIVLPARFPRTSSSRSEIDYGNVPNRFIADVTDGCQAGNAAVKAVHEKWKQMTASVWTQFVKPVACRGNNTQAIWDRQIEHFWEITWAVSESNPLPSRKNWRTGPLTVEAGDHCTMMGQWQELSGYIRSCSNEQQDDFWEGLRGRVGKLDLDIDERLCAIALVKRLYPKVFEVANTLNANNWPSTVYVAAVPWLTAVARNCPEIAKSYAEKVGQAAGESFGERHNHFPGLSELKASTGDFLSLDGNFFQLNALKNERVTPFDLPDEDSEPLRKALLKSLEQLRRTAKSKAPSTFYAVILMDGDSMGELLTTARRADNEANATQALTKFSSSAPDVAKRHNGVTIYAGGDDVLVMSPLADALRCAEELAKLYSETFSVCGTEIAAKATISAAIVYAHYHSPLREVLATAHQLLDNVAKETTGRDSLAIAVFKSSGITAQWSAPWKYFRGANNGDQNIIDAVCRRVRKADVGDAARGGEFSSSFFYNIRERFAALTDKPLTSPGEFGRLSPELQRENLFQKVLEAEFRRGLSHRNESATGDSCSSSSEATRAINDLLKLCHRVTRDSKTGQLNPMETDTLGIDGALLVQFLATEGEEVAE